MQKRYVHYLLSITLLFLGSIIVISGNNKQTIVTYNVNSVKSLEAVHMVDKYNSLIADRKNKEFPLYASFQQAILEAPKEPVAFMGKLTAYGPDCVGCSGGSACPPRQNFTHGNIYFNDQLYGQVRVVAADRSLPCGSIVRISGVNIYEEPLLAVVLDRGGSITGNHLDLLFSSENNLEGFATSSNIKFEIIRYGW